MAVFRVSKNTNYVVMDRTSLNDPNLSWKAKGLLAYMLSMPDDWTFYDTELEKHAKDGRDALKAAIKELKTHRYMRRERKTGDGGKFIWETTVFEKPYTDLPYMDKPLTEKPLMDNPSMENPQLLSTDELSTESLSTDSTKNINTDQQAAPKSDYSTEFESFWTSYPRKVDKKQAYRKWKEALKNHTAEDIMSGVAGYNQHIKKNKTETTYIKHAKTFLSNESFKDFTAGGTEHERNGRGTPETPVKSLSERANERRQHAYSGDVPM